MIFELAPAQQDIYLEGKLFGKVVNNIGGYQVYRCALDIPRFRQARDWLLRGNDAYHLRFNESDGECSPFVSDAPPAALRIVDCTTEASALAWANERMATAFADISTDVFEDALLRLATGEYWYFAKAHHLIMDGWGFALQMRRLLGMYERLGASAETQAQAHSPQPSLVDYMRRQSDYRSSREYVRSRDYWLSRHDSSAGSLFPPLHVPTTIGSRRVSLVMETALIAPLRQLAADAKADLVTIMYAVLYLYFSRACQRDVITIASPVHNRRSAIDKDIIGSIVNVNLHQLAAKTDLSFAGLIEYVSSVLRQDHRHGRFPLGDLVRALRERHGAQDDLPYEIAFNYQKLDFGFSIHGAPVETHYLSHFQERVPLTFVLCEYGNQDIRLHLDYAASYFEESHAEALLKRVMGLLHQAAENGHRPLDDYRLLLPAEWHDQFVAWQGTETPLRQGACIQDFFEEQVLRTPDRVAASCGQHSLTYSELNRKANRLAHRLIEHGAAPGRMVGICHGRSLDLVVALMAVLKSGATYVPIDPGYPAPRIRHILDDAQPGIVIVDEPGATALGLFHGVTIRTDASAAEATQDYPSRTDLACQNPARSMTGLSAQDTAYVIYTSGSTGRPKGVLIEHRNAAAFIEWALAQYSPSELATVLAATSICFDLSIFEIFVPLAIGGRIVLVENVLALRDHHIDGFTLINTVPSAIRGLLEADAIPESLRCINLAGEMLHQELVDELYSRLGAVKIYDLYGPSESTTYSTVCLRAHGGSASIGKPIHNTRVYVLDESGGPLPPGMIGEIHIGGAGLARGYLHQPAMTAEKFVFNRHADARLYRTGDLARWTADGQLQYRGRKDHQEKIRGFRVEPGEIEACLLEHPAVADCVVVGHGVPGGTEGRFLAAYVVAAHDAGEEPFAEAHGLIDALARFVATRLPAQSVPSRFVILPALPLTPNGKVDRRALPAPGDMPHDNAAYEAPRNEMERKLDSLWQAALQQEGIGIHDSFFSRGGDSLLLLKLASSIEREFKLRIDLPLLFANSTIDAQARLLTEQLELERLRLAVNAPHETQSGTFIDL